MRKKEKKLINSKIDKFDRKMKIISVAANRKHVETTHFILKKSLQFL